MERIPDNSRKIASWLKLFHSYGVGSVTFSKLIKHFGSVDTALGASVSQLKKINGIGSKTANSIVTSRDRYDPQSELELAEKLRVWIINIEDPRYPTLLKRIYDPPPVLYIKGTLSRADNLSVAIVGSRRCSLYGQEQASRFAHFLAGAGFTICSGMARGIDSAAHQGALSAQGRTIAVQGCGLANIFPPENKKLFQMIAESGACISELPLQYEPLSENFPSRNRIIAGLSLGTIVIEAGLRSGALITAHAALTNNREVMAVPGKIDSPMSKGTNSLIKAGAKLIDSVDDIVESLGYIGQQLKEHVTASVEETENSKDISQIEAKELKLSGDERKIYDSIKTEAIHIEEVIQRTGLGAGKVNAGVVALRLKGLIRVLPGNHFKSK
ncbi:MAG: DNA-processing protein DprA [Planctomycetota bacterium]|jgi:DNA processing protein